MARKGQTSEAITGEENIQLQRYHNDFAKKAIMDDNIKIAISHLKKAIYYGEKGNGLIMLLHLLIEKEKYDDAIKYASHAISLDPHNGKAIYLKSLSYFYTEDYRNAIQYFKETLSVGGYLTHEQILSTNYYAAISYFHLGKYSLALDYFERVGKIQPTFEDLSNWIKKTQKKMR